MELILRDESLIKVKPLENAVFKCSYGVVGSGNDFSLQIPYDRNNASMIWRYANYGNTEFGGKILETVIDTAKEIITLYGFTFRGTMENIIVTPTDDIIVSGKDYEIIKDLFGRTTLNYIVLNTFNAMTKEILIPKGFSLLRAIEKVLREFNEKFSISIEDNNIYFSISAIETLDSRIDASQTSMELDNNKMLPNCLIAVGTINGEKAVGRLYADENNNLVDERYFTGDKAIEVWREYDSDFTSEQEFRANMVDEFYNLRNKGAKTDVSVELTTGDINDKVKVSVAALNVSILQTIIERHIEYKNGNAKFTYSMGG